MDKLMPTINRATVRMIVMVGPGNGDDMTEAATFGASDGLSMAYYIDDFTDPWKNAPTLLLLHAAMGSARRYFAWVPHLARDYRVLRLDLRGHGRSQVPPAEQKLTLGRLVLDVAELLDHLGVA